MRLYGTAMKEVDRVFPKQNEGEHIVALCGCLVLEWHGRRACALLTHTSALTPTQHSLRTEWFLVQMGVLPEHQAHGIGRMFMSMVVQWCDEQSCKCNTLVFHQRQVSFLEKWGFRVLSTTAEANQPTFYTLQRAPQSSKRMSVTVSTGVTVGALSGSSTLSRRSVVSVNKGLDSDNDTNNSNSDGVSNTGDRTSASKLRSSASAPNGSK